MYSLTNEEDDLDDSNSHTHTQSGLFINAYMCMYAYEQFELSAPRWLPCIIIILFLIKSKTLQKLQRSKCGHRQIVQIIINAILLKYNLNVFETMHVQ